MYAHGTTLPAPPSNSGEFPAAEVARDHPHASRVGRLCRQPMDQHQHFSTQILERLRTACLYQ